MKALHYIWLFFTAIFVGLAIFSFIMSKKSVENIKPFSRPGKKMGDVAEFMGADIDAPVNNFLDDFNKYIEGYNKSTNGQNMIAFYGYLAAAITSAVSFCIGAGWIK